jgi:hypothetical protein
MRKLLFLAFILIIAHPAFAEIVRQKNVATYVTFPIMATDGTLISSATGLDSEIDAYSDGAAPDGFADCTNEATEIGSTGQYYLSLAQGEMNADYIIIQVKSSSSGAITQTLLIRTMVGDPLLLATTDDGGTINVTGGAVDTVTTTGTATAVTTVNGLANNVITAASINTDAIGADEIAADAGTEIGTAAWTTDISAYSGAKAGTYLKSVYDKLPTNYIMGSAVQTDKDDDIDAILTDTAAVDTSTEIRTLLTGSDTAVSTLTPANVWQTDISEYSTVGYAGTYLKNAGAAADPWSTTLPGAYGEGSAGYIIGTNLDTTVSSRGTSTLTTSDNIGINWADVSNPTTAVNLSGTNIKTDQVVASVSGAVGSVTGGVTVTTNNDKTGYTVSTVSDKTGYSLAADQAVNVTKFGGTAVTGRDIGASVLLSPGTGTGQISLASGAVTVGTNSDKTGYTLSQSFPTNFSSLAITEGGAVTAGTVSDKTGYTVSTVSDKTGYSLTQTFPSNFEHLSITDTTGLVDITQTAADKCKSTTVY